MSSIDDDHDPNDGWISKRQAAELLRLSERSIERLVHSRKIQSSERAAPGRRPLVVLRLADVEQIARSERHRPSAGRVISGVGPAGLFDPERVALLERVVGQLYIELLVLRSPTIK